MTSLLVAVLLLQAPPDAGVVDMPTFSPVLDAFGSYQVRIPSEGPVWNSFQVPRVHVGVLAQWHGVEARVLLEGVYASQGGALLGVAGDSLVVRLREAWGGYTWRFLEARLGLVRSLLIPEQEAAWRFRSLAADALESFNLNAPADFGATLRANLPNQLGFVAVGLTNGEGYASRELNPQKNVEVAAVLKPFKIPLSAQGVAIVGSQGVPASMTNRFGGGLTWNSDTLGLGVHAYSVQGLLQDGARRAFLVQAFARATLFEHLLVAGRVAHLSRDLARDDSQLELLGALGFGIGPLESFVAVARTSLFGAAAGALPGTESTDVRVIVRVKWLPVFSPTPGTL
jgi:hypothetical protein